MLILTDLTTVNTKDLWSYGVKNKEIKCNSKMFANVTFYLQYYSNTCFTLVFDTNWTTSDETYNYIPIKMLTIY